VSAERTPPPDLRESARANLLWELKTAGGKNLRRVIREGEGYVHHYPDDVEVAEALNRAERRRQEHGAG
jgi:hypothetical protein